jgi:hypothetical protein
MQDTKNNKRPERPQISEYGRDIITGFGFTIEPINGDYWHIYGPGRGRVASFGFYCSNINQLDVYVPGIGSALFDCGLWHVERHHAEKYLIGALVMALHLDKDPESPYKMEGGA